MLVTRPFRLKDAGAERRRDGNLARWSTIAVALALSVATADVCYGSGDPSIHAIPFPSDKNQDSRVDVEDLFLALQSREALPFNDLRLLKFARDWHVQLLEPDFFYYGSFGKVPLQFSTEWVAAWFASESTDSDREAVVERIPTLELYSSRRQIGDTLVLLLLHPTENIDIVLETLAQLEAAPFVTMTSPVMGQAAQRTESLLNGEIVAQFTESASSEEIRTTIESLGLTIDHESTRWTVHRVPGKSALLGLHIANLLHESTLTNWAQPNFAHLHSFNSHMLRPQLTSVEFTLDEQQKSFSPNLENDLYYYDDRGRPVPLSLVRDRLYVNLAVDSATTRIRHLLEDISGRLCSFQDSGNSIVQFDRPIEEPLLLNLVNDLAQEDEISIVSPVFSPGGEFTFHNEVLVSFHQHVGEATRCALHNQFGVQTVYENPSWMILRTPSKSGLDTLQIANRYYESGLVEWSQPDQRHISGGFPALNHPNDPHYYDSGMQKFLQWYFHNDGNYPSGSSADADIDAPEGWGLATGGTSNLVIGFVDSGIDLDHEDLEDKLWTNTGEIPDNNEDDDNNDYDDDVHGYDFADGDDADGPNDLYNHGTAAAGIAAGDTDNGEGIAGVFWGGKLMALKVSTGSTQTVDDADVAKAIRYAADEGASIISINWDKISANPDEEPDAAIKTEIKRARNEKGIPIIGAAENRSEDFVFYPARYAQVISVGATDHTNKKWSYSNYGPNLDVMAPSGSRSANIPMEVASNDGSYRSDFDGTSGAQPQVVGLAALLLSQNPNLTAAEIQTLIQVSADDPVGPTPVSTPTPGEDPPGWDPYYGWGKINVHAALATETALPGSPRGLGRFAVYNASPVPTPVWAIDQYGFMYLRGSVKGTLLPTPFNTPIPTENPSKDEVLLERSDGSPAALVDAESGDLFLRGEITTKQAVPTPNPSNSEFILRDTDGTPVALLNEDGDLYIKGEYYNESAP